MRVYCLTQSNSVFACLPGSPLPCGPFGSAVTQRQLVLAEILGTAQDPWSSRQVAWHPQGRRPHQLGRNRHLLSHSASRPYSHSSAWGLARNNTSRDPFLSQCPGLGNLLGCLLLHLCIKAQPSKNDGCPGEKGRELESSYSIQWQSAV